MVKRPIRYQELELYLTYALIADAILFILYLICAGFGVIWLKVILAILAFLVSAAILVLLYLRKELLRRRSFWMTAGALAVLVCLLLSLILNYPSPNPYKKADTQNQVAAVQSQQLF